MSVRMKQLGFHWIYFHELWHFNIFRKYDDRNQVSLKSYNNNGYFTGYQSTVFIISRSFLLRMGILQITVLDKIRTHTKNVCDFDRASSLICGNKIATRCDRQFLLQILLLAQHVYGTTMPIIRSSIVLYRWLLPAVFGALVFKLSV